MANVSEGSDLQFKCTETTLSYQLFWGFCEALVGQRMAPLIRMACAGSVRWRSPLKFFDLHHIHLVRCLNCIAAGYKHLALASVAQSVALMAKMAVGNPRRM